jgi:hypothetical protein
MTPETTASPYDSAIADVETRIARLQTTLETLKQLRSEGGFASQPAQRNSAGSTIENDTFFGMTIADAAKKYLAMVKATKSTSEIAEALERGGLKHSSKQFTVTVRSILNPRDEFVRVNNDWGLAEWYPGMRKAKKATPSQESKPDAQEPSVQQTDKSVPGPQGGDSIDSKILRLFQDHPDKRYNAPSLASALGAQRNTIGACLSVLNGKGRIQKFGHGLYGHKAA